MDLRDSLVNAVRTRVAIGADPCATIAVEAAGDLARAGDADEVGALAWRVTAEEFAAHRAAQKAWPATTDNDRLTAAFHDLGLAGIVAREHFSCCLSCGTGEIEDEVDEGAAAGERLYIAYGLFGAPPTAEIGQEITHCPADGPEERGVPMHAAEAIDLVRRMPPRHGSFAVAVGRSGGVVRMRWEHGRLRLETPDTATATSTGRHVSLAEAERVLSILATQDSVAVSELAGVRTVARGTDD